MSEKSERLRRIAEKAIEKSGDNLEVALRRASMIALRDPATALEVAVEELANEVRAKHPI